MNREVRFWKKTEIGLHSKSSAGSCSEDMIDGKHSAFRNKDHHRSTKVYMDVCGEKTLEHLIGLERSEQSTIKAASKNSPSSPGQRGDDKRRKG